MIIQLAQEIPSPSTGVALSGLGALLTTTGALVGWMWRVTSWSTTRVDTITASQIRVIGEERDRAFRERDEERAERVAAQRQVEVWSAKCQELAIQLARCQATIQHLHPDSGTEPNDDMTP